MVENKQEFDFTKVWNEPVIRIGWITVLLGSLFAFFPSLYLWITYKVFPPLPMALKAWGLVATAFGAFYVVEPISYYAVLGLSGTYMGFLSGNIGNLRVPCAAMALEVTEAESGTPEAEIAATLGIAGSIITNLIGVTLAAIIGAALIKIFPPVIAEAFKTYTVPAIFGAVFGQFAIRYPKVSIFGLAIPLFFLGVLKFPAWAVIPIAVFGTIGISRLFYNQEKKHSQA
ncbi:MAG: hypothetical protein GX489_01690 [Firmicutes bacterium]|nr:hypothetical protein [Bacillota bacterium]